MSTPPSAAAPPTPPASSASAAPCPRRAAALDLTLVLGLELVASSRLGRSGIRSVRMW